MFFEAALPNAPRKIVTCVFLFPLDPVKVKKPFLLSHAFFHFSGLAVFLRGFLFLLPSKQGLDIFSLGAGNTPTNDDDPSDLFMR